MSSNDTITIILLKETAEEIFRVLRPSLDCGIICGEPEQLIEYNAVNDLCNKIKEEIEK